MACKRWVEKCGRADLLNTNSNVLNNRYSLCADHFEESMFMNINERNRLVHDAVPNLFDEADATEEKHNSTEAEVEIDVKTNVNLDHLYSIPTTTTSGTMTNEVELVDVGTATPQFNFITTKLNSVTTTLATCTGTGDKCGAGAMKRHYRDFLNSNQRSVWQQTDPPSRRDKVTSTTRLLKTVEELNLRKTIRRQYKQMSRMQKQIDNLQERLTKATKSYKVSDIIEGSKRYLNGLSHSFFTTQLMLSSKKAQGKRWPDDVKKFAVSIFKSSSKAYKLLAKEFILPSKKSIRKVAMVEGDSVDNAINSVVQSSNFKISDVPEFSLRLINTDENFSEQQVGSEMPENGEMVQTQSFQQLDDILKFGDSILPTSASDGNNTLTMSIKSGNDQVEMTEEQYITADSDLSVPIVTQHIQDEDGNVSIIYPSVQELQQILPMEIFHYMVQQT
ncbi:hypothetical protein CHUAL_012185 [Chamberlinius hualienensis]